jgi:hypothetical protein
MSATALTFAVGCSDDDGGNDDQEICNNGLDDDGDGMTDCADADCLNAQNCQVACDNDGICDAGEDSTNCPNDCAGTEICDNQLDDDGDGQVDCNDSDCASDSACSSVCNNDGTCDSAQGENETNCPNDCGGGGDCSTTADLVEQNGCGASEKCTLVDQSGSLGCATAGATDNYAECGSGGTDDCLAGAICAGAQGATPTCMPYCETTADCPGGGLCLAAIDTAAGQVGLCIPGDDCDPVDYDAVCATGEGCYLASENGDTICATAGTAQAGDACQAPNDCAAGLACGQSGCVELCKDNADCTSGTCQGIGQVMPGFSDIGACQ